MADVLTTLTDVNRQDVFSALVQRELIASSKIAATVLDVTQYCEKGMKSISFPRASTFVVNDKVAGTAASAQKLTWALDQMDLNYHKVIQWLIEDSASTQAVVNLEVDAVQRAARALAKQVDVDIYTQLKAASASAPDQRIAFVGSTLAQQDIVNGLQLLDAGDVPEEDRYLAIHPAEKAAMLMISNFIKANEFGNANAIQNGKIGEIYGMTVLCTTAVSAGLPVMYHRESCAFGLQIAPKFDSQKDLANLGTRYSVNQLYGVKELQAGKMSVLLGSAT